MFWFYFLVLEYRHNGNCQKGYWQHCASYIGCIPMLCKVVVYFVVIVVVFVVIVVVYPTFTDEAAGVPWTTANLETTFCQNQVIIIIIIIIVIIIIIIIVKTKNHHQ